MTGTCRPGEWAATAALRLAAVIGVLGIAAAAQRPRPDLGPGDLQHLVFATGSDGVTTCRVDLPRGPSILRLVRDSVRSERFRVLVDDGSGILRRFDTGPPKTVSGMVVGVPGSRVAGSLDATGLHAVVADDHGRTWIEPAVAVVPGGWPGAHAVYHDRQLGPTGMSCGLDDRAAAPPPWQGPGPASAVSGLTVADLACDADHEFFTRYGSVAAATDRIELVINAMNAQYESEVSIRHYLSTVVVRSAPGTPYTSTDPSVLLSQFQTVWNAAPYASITRSAAQLFTGKNLGGVYVGLAFRGTVCDVARAYSLVQSDFSTLLAYSTDLSAHELGHNWGASHCACPNYTMHPVNMGSNTFSAVSRGVIQSYAASVTCLSASLPTVWVDFAYTGRELGTAAAPFNTLGEGLGHLSIGGTLQVLPGTSSETPAITAPAVLKAPSGGVTIGR